MNEQDKWVKIKSELDQRSPSLCLAKWLQVSLHLQNGTTHSCHHPVVHKVPFNELNETPAALHNTKFKKYQRKLMIEGKRPQECQYCWIIEDHATDEFSDRIYKSASDWAMPHLNEVEKALDSKNINPTYLEVSFGNECHFKCAYCSPTVSSAILSEFLKYGHYKSNPFFELDNLKKIGQYPYSRDEFNPYVEAFWRWWPELKATLKVFRLTGGEPLLQPDTFKLLESILFEPIPSLDLAINSNLSVSDKTLDRFIELSQRIMAEKSVRKFEIYTSLDTSGDQAEYIRYGLQIERFLANVEKILQEVPNVKITFMCTLNALSLPSFTTYLEILRNLKLRYLLPDGTTRVIVSLSPLRLPAFLSLEMVPVRYIDFLEKSLNYMLRYSREDHFFVFSEHEISQLRRVLMSLKSKQLDDVKKILLQKQFFSFIKEYDERKGLDFQKTFPEFSEFIFNFKTQGFDL